MSAEHSLAKNTGFLIQPKNRATLFVAGLLLFLILAYFLKALTSPSGVIYSAHSDLINYVSKLHFIELTSFSTFRQLPLWNPYSLLGNSLVGSTLSWMFYPFNLPYLLSSSPLISTFNFIIHSFMLGLFTFLYVRKISGNTTAAIFSALAITFSGKILLFPYDGYTFFLGFAYFPMLLLLTELTIEKRSPGYAVLLAAATALQFLGLHIQLFFYSMVALSLYIIFRLFVEYRRKGRAVELRKPILLLTAAAIIFLMLSAFQLLPMLESLRISDRGSADTSFAQTYRFSPLNFIAVILPNLLGTPLHDTEFGPPNFWEQNAYFGITALILAALAIIYLLKKNVYVMFFALLVLFSFFFSLGYLNRLPLFDFFRIPSRMLYFAAFAISVLCGYGAAIISKSRIREVKAVYALPALLIILLILTAAFIALKQDAVSFLENSINKRLESGQISKEKADKYIEKAGIIYRDIRNDLIKATAFLALSAAAIFLALKAERKALKTAMVSLILAIMLADLWMFGLPFFSVADQRTVFAKDEIISAMEADNETYRVLDFSNRSNLYSAIALMHGINIISLDSQNLNSEVRYITTAFGIEQKNYNTETSLEPETIQNPSLIGLLNVKYIISDKPITTLNTTLAAESGKKRLYKNANYKERAFIAYDVMPLEKEDEVFSRLKDNSTDYSRLILIEKKPGGNIPELKGGNNENMSYAIRLTKQSPNEIKISASTASPGFLFLSEPYAPGWKASVDGNANVDLYKANGAFMGIFLAEGEHSIKLNYAPGSLALGTAISAVTAGSILAYCMSLAIFRKRKEAGATNG